MSESVLNSDYTDSLVGFPRHFVGRESATFLQLGGVSFSQLHYCLLIVDNFSSGISFSPCSVSLFSGISLLSLLGLSFLYSVSLVLFSRSFAWTVSNLRPLPRS